MYSFHINRELHSFYLWLGLLSSSIYEQKKNSSFSADENENNNATNIKVPTYIPFKAFLSDQI